MQTYYVISIKINKVIYKFTLVSMNILNKFAHLHPGDHLLEETKIFPDKITSP